MLARFKQTAFPGHFPLQLPTMTDSEHLRAYLHQLRWSQRELAQVLGCNYRLVRRWAADDPDYPIPLVVFTWLRELAEFHRAHPPPHAWRHWPS